MSCLLQISDPHFGTERPEVLQALERFAEALAPQVVVMSGDITQRATRVQFAAARAFVDRLAAPATLVIPGNHDIPLFDLAARCFSPYGRYMEAFGDDLEPVSSPTTGSSSPSTRRAGTGMKTAWSRPRRSSGWRSGWRPQRPRSCAWW
jgi:predicted MPP superfamily phosphohydrolase